VRNLAGLGESKPLHREEKKSGYGKFLTKFFLLTLF
jgi:hypothetical protein